MEPVTQHPAPNELNKNKAMQPEGNMKKMKLAIRVLAALVIVISCKGAEAPAKLKGAALALADGTPISQATTDEYNPYVVKMPDGYLMLVFGSDRSCGGCTAGTHNIFVARSVAVYNDDAKLPAFNVPAVFTVGGTPLNLTSSATFVATKNGASVRLYINNASGDIQYGDLAAAGPTYNVAALTAITNTTWKAAKLVGIEAAGTRVFARNATGIYLVDPRTTDGALVASVISKTADSVAQINPSITGSNEAYVSVVAGTVKSASFTENGGAAAGLNTTIAAAKILLKNLTVLQTGAKAGEFLFLSGSESGNSKQDLFVVDGLTPAFLWEQLSPKPVSVGGADRPRLIAAFTTTLTSAQAVFSQVIAANSLECGSASACAGKFSLTGSISINSVVSSCGAGVNCQKFTLTTTTQSAATQYTLTTTPNVAIDLAGRTVDAVNTATYTSGDVVNNLLAYYKFDGNANDTQGTYNPTFNSATLANDRFGNSNRAYDFNGTTRIEVPPINFNSTGASVSAWVNMTSFPSFSSIARDDSAKIALTFAPSGTTLTFQLNLPGFGYHNVTVGINAADYTDGNWHHIVGTYDGAFFRLYKDGAEIGNSAYSFAGTLSTGTVQAIGGTLSGENCVGRVDEVRFYNRGLTAAEVAAIYWLEK